MFKVLNVVMGVLAVIICLGAIGIIVYSSLRPSMGGSVPPEEATLSGEEGDVSGNDLATATIDPNATPGSTATPSAVADDHVHNYIEKTEKEPDCLDAGRKEFLCACGAFYYEEIAALGHIEGEWQIKTAATDTQTGLRVKECIYCDIILASDVIPVGGDGDDNDDNDSNGSDSDEPHVHDFVATIESSPSCTVAGIRRYVCSCGSFYRENIPAIGHIVSDWTVTTAASTTGTGLRQRLCSVCRSVIDSQVIPVSSGSAAPSGSPRASGATIVPNPSATVTPGTSPTPSATPTPHSHSFSYYVYKSPTCIASGIETGNCICGAEDSRPIPADPTRHRYVATIVKPTATAEGYTRFRCSICGDSYVDDEVPATGN
ncbi:MAG: hypothetical protein LBV33_08990 [Lachnospiraceae bacterium]|jgi:hypothetical protein|nr:hypothetical protein [Lachnospiraceae bacterium]